MTDLKIVRRRASELKLDPRNARKHPTKNLEAIRASIVRFGQRLPIIVRPDGTIVGGNGTFSCMLELGFEEVDVVLFEGDDDAARALAIALNRSGELATWDEEVLIDALRGMDDDLRAAAGFLDADIMRLGIELERDSRDAGSGFTPAVPRTHLGDVWVLGPHRLLCGDSASSEDVDRLVAGAMIGLVSTDPPYGVSLKHGANNAAQGWRASGPGLENDDLDPAEYEARLLGWFGSIARVLRPGGSFYIWGGYANLENYPPALRACGLYFSQVIVWDKQHPVLTRKDYMGGFELCFYGWREGAGHEFLGPTNAKDIWQVKKVSPGQMVHLTEKPTELAVRAMENSSRRGDVVLDLFGGSGSTLIAAQQTGRVARVMELDPGYCDVIVDRWQKTFGAEAVRESDGTPFDKVLTRGAAETAQA